MKGSSTWLEEGFRHFSSMAPVFVCCRERKKRVLRSRLVASGPDKSWGAAG